MAKSNTIQVKMVSTADTGYFYVKFRNPKTKTEKLELKKYDPKARKHVIFKEQKNQIVYFLIFLTSKPKSFICLLDTSFGEPIRRSSAC